MQHALGGELQEVGCFKYNYLVGVMPPSHTTRYLLVDDLHVLWCNLKSNVPLFPFPFTDRKCEYGKG